MREIYRQEDRPKPYRPSTPAPLAAYLVWYDNEPIAEIQCADCWGYPTARMRRSTLYLGADVPADWRCQCRTGQPYEVARDGLYRYVGQPSSPTPEEMT